ncbi:protein of unknown function (plasmid) [Cupriavidus taiwanensis]|uniref:Uncharacterized protein n=1 Tax=Cupriavidus taiwanensis TaxID=164546 RepID=A0A375FLF4_9BURK|nr:protein of unknown function [Cupriavidus taiwanensis]SOZ72378.1 protein of unknown function [Cupriavidus taiwanensis]SOZ74714.1 protein of unknown function [Cupriavidus taiwanensis]SPA11483.1 protein of unknown function [Cupriavidus taiwanensis]SPA57391.1 protein of unknown function [Cupriavidus taiwanensis]
MDPDAELGVINVIIRPTVLERFRKDPERVVGRRPWAVAVRARGTPADCPARGGLVVDAGPTRHAEPELLPTAPCKRTAAPLLGRHSPRLVQVSRSARLEA